MINKIIYSISVLKPLVNSYLLHRRIRFLSQKYDTSRIENEIENNAIHSREENLKVIGLDNYIPNRNKPRVIKDNGSMVKVDSLTEVGTWYQKVSNFIWLSTNVSGCQLELNVVGGRRVSFNGTVYGQRVIISWTIGGDDWNVRLLSKGASVTDSYVGRLENMPVYMFLMLSHIMKSMESSGFDVNHMDNKKAVIHNTEKPGTPEHKRIFASFFDSWSETDDEQYDKVFGAKNPIKLSEQKNNNVIKIDFKKKRG